MTTMYVEPTTLIDSDRESNKSEDDTVTKEQEMFIWNIPYEKWHECHVSFSPPSLMVTEYEDLRLEVTEKQLLHLKQKWFHGGLSRREARNILQDFGGGNGSFLVRSSESYHGKFAISFVHESRVKHVVIESKRDPVAGVLYHITPNGPVFESLYQLVEEAQKSAVIQNHMFDVVLGKCPPKPDTKWLHKGTKSLSQAEQILRKEHRDGAFFVYGTQSEYAPYIVAYRSNGNILHNLIVTTQRQSQAYSLNGIHAPVLYKLIHYFMENPINGTTVLKYPVEDRDPVTTNCGMAVKDYRGTGTNELCFTTGTIIKNISQKSPEWSIGDHRGDRQRYFPSNCIKLLTKEELAYVNEVRSNHSRCVSPEDSKGSSTHIVNLQGDYTVEFKLDECTMSVRPSNPVIKNSFRKFKLSCPSIEDLELWYQCFQQANCLPKDSQEEEHGGLPTKKGRRRSRQKGSRVCSIM